ncbi:recQ-mediated genome instability protein 1 [Conger conger]|uniref:recQ-mediated genome instability protein 1 n=1 Tax=Conger conger TaxID=82655 RepID=UPI002A5AF591|nr:recQ-mediated genome instability protein 1 [Conger conger]XP_061115748.1 recQ-mediated genome instability protein 1 [Conger conger]
MSDPELVRRAQEWLSSTRHVQVPRNWLEACSDWLAREAGGAPVSQTRLNQQALEQWLHTDLRVLAHPVLPPLGRALKTELSGSFCVQMDSALDVSRPAYAQLRQRRGTDCANEGVSAATQASLRPWEAAPTRVLVLRLTDGVQDLEAMEYQPVPGLNADLPPGTKLLLHGRLECRLRVLLLTPANVRVLGGAVEELQEVLSQNGVLARVLGLPQEERRPAPRDEGASDEELLASLEAAADSGYGSREGRPPAPQRAVAPGDLDEDFDDLPLDELDSVIFLEDSDPVVVEEEEEPGPMEVEPRINGAGHGPAEVEPDAWEVEPDPMEVGPRRREVQSGPVAVVLRANGVGPAPVEVEPRTRKLGPGPVAVGPGTKGVGPGPLEAEPETGACRSGVGPPLGSACVSGGSRDSGVDRVCAVKPQSRAGEETQEAASPQGASEGGAGTVSVATDSVTPPFTYLCVLARGGARQARLKAFIITLQGSLRSSSGAWQVSATISDGTGYLDVRLSDRVLAGFIGFSVAESRLLRKDPERQHRVQEGLQRCQRALVDMCCLMTLQYDPAAQTGTVLSADPVTAQTCRELEDRVRGPNRR